MSRHKVVIVGAGPAGIFAALELVGHGISDVLMVEKGKALAKRNCPARQTACVKCKVCDIMTGWGGAGAFSDGKLTLTTDVGGWLGDYMPRADLEELLAYADKLWIEFGVTARGARPRRRDRRSAREAGDTGRHASRPDDDPPPRHRPVARRARSDARLAHRPRGGGPNALRGIRDPRRRWARTRRRARGRRDRGRGVRRGAPGREGADWLAEQAGHLGLALVNNAVDIGVRIECPAPVMEPLTDPLYEAKLIYHTKAFGDQVRTFCMNPYGEVTTESYGDVVTVNGHSYAEEKTAYTNFAVLVSTRFTEPFRDPITYGRSIAKLANLLGDGILVQRFTDLKAGRRSTPERIAQSIVEPTLACATPGDLSAVLPYRHLTDIIEFIETMDRLVPGLAGPNTLMYGVEVKFYSSRISVGRTLETEVPGLYAVGDGAGITRGLVQSSASGVIAARAIVEA